MKGSGGKNSWGTNAQKKVGEVLSDHLKICRERMVICSEDKMTLEE
jgi:hypothetical protein